MHDRAAEQTEPCTACGGARTGWAAQSVEDGRLHRTLEWLCACGQVCDRGRGPAPGGVREAVIARHGTHLLVLADPQTRSGAVPKAFRDVFGLSLVEAARAAAALRGPGWEGTHPEVRLLAELLASAGLPTAVH
ncbi:hypothetical protein [Nocardiopsis sp. CC223A]|uniref:hypothetical protein n=1 Tax=Nocardiopsis sp. CC223A TaxID=3044051 RepID=UPI00278BC5B9|nr:hypothetical protein [Nocardiopsis sp. CC223A]